MARSRNAPISAAGPFAGEPGPPTNSASLAKSCADAAQGVSRIERPSVLGPEGAEWPPDSRAPAVARAFTSRVSCANTLPNTIAGINSGRDDRARCTHVSSKAVSAGILAALSFEWPFDGAAFFNTGRFKSRKDGGGLLQGVDTKTFPSGSLKICRRPPIGFLRLLHELDAPRLQLRRRRHDIVGYPPGLHHAADHLLLTRRGEEHHLRVSA